MQIQQPLSAVNRKIYFLYIFTNFAIKFFKQISLWQCLGADAGCFWYQFTDFGHTNLGMPKFNLK